MHTNRKESEREAGEVDAGGREGEEHIVCVIIIIINGETERARDRETESLI